MALSLRLVTSDFHAEQSHGSSKERVEPKGYTRGDRRREERTVISKGKSPDLAWYHEVISLTAIFNIQIVAWFLGTARRGEGWDKEQMKRPPAWSSEPLCQALC